MVQNWKIRARATHCAATGRAFKKGDLVQTCIYEDPESEGFVRKDFAADVYDAGSHDEGPPFSTWRSRYEPPAPKPEGADVQLQKAGAEGLLRRLVEEDDPATERARYVLAVMLERRRILKPGGQEAPEGRKVLFYEHARTGEAFLIADPGIRLDEVEAVQAEVIGMLDGEPES